MPDAAPLNADPSDLLRHLALERVSSQWSDFLALLSAELVEQLSADEYRGLLRRLGESFARQNPVAASSDVAQLEAAFNATWARMRWGFVRISEQGAALRVVHRASPLSAALQVDTDVAAGYLEGVYAVWLQQAGAPAGLVLRQAPSDGSPMQMVFELAAA
jgi:hypothetical protein